MRDPEPLDDYRHVQAQGETEAFYFFFTAVDLSVFGVLRLLFHYDRVLEIVALCVAGRLLVHQVTHACEPLAAADPAPRAGALALTCLAPWEHWRLRFTAPVAGEPVAAALEFNATNPAAGYQFGPYIQGEQEGRLRGALRVGVQRWEEPLLCYRDHSWGQRPMRQATGWDAFIVPERGYMALAQTTPPFFFGRVYAPGGVWRAVTQPAVTLDAEAATVAVPGVDFEPLHVERAAAPISAYLGAPGCEAIREAPLPGDGLREDIGPAWFTDAQGNCTLGFWDHAVRVPEANLSQEKDLP